MQPTALPYLHFTDADGEPLDGFVWFGLPGQNPETAQIPVYWDYAGTQPASQPIKIQGGYAWRSGTPGTLFVSQAYSITVRKANGAMVYTASDSSQFDPGSSSASSASQWVPSTQTPIYNSATSFVVPDDQTEDFHIGRRLRLFHSTIGYVYGIITSSVYTSSTTVTISADNGVPLTASLQAVELSILRADIQALPVFNGRKGQTLDSNASMDLASTWSNYLTINGTATIATFGLAAEGMRRTIVAGGAFTITYSASGLILPGGATIKAAVGDVFEFIGMANGGWKCLSYSPVAGTPIVNNARLVPVRQTVLSGPVDSNGLAAFGGSTGSSTVTASGTLIATAANGFDAFGQVNRIGSITNPSWVNLNTNGQMYLFLDIAADGTCTTGSTTIAPTYQWGGSAGVASGQFTYNIQEAVGKVGNGSAASQVYRVFVGEVTVASNVVSAITWYQPQGRYVGPWTGTLPSSSSTTTISHNLGIPSASVKPQADFEIECTTADVGASVGDAFINPNTFTSTIPYSSKPAIAGNTAYVKAGNNGWGILNGGASAALAAASWKYRFRVTRGW